jgi:Uma2 family endonuclease
MIVADLSTELVTNEPVVIALDQFLGKQAEAPFEWIDGKVIPVSPSIYESGEVASRLAEALFQYRTVTQSIKIYMDTTFVLPNTSSDWVKGSRIPDLMVYQATRLVAYREAGNWRGKPLMLVPDLVVEIISPTDRLADVWRKVSMYLDDGVQTVWVITPQQEQVTVFTQTQAPITLDKSAVLEGGSVLPNFALAIHTLFDDEPISIALDAENDLP